MNKAPEKDLDPFEDGFLKNPWEIETGKGKRSTYAGIWRTNGTTGERKLIRPHWNHFKLDHMLEKSLKEKTFSDGSAKWSSRGGVVSLKDGREGEKNVLLAFRPDDPPLEWKKNEPGFVRAGHTLFALAFVEELRKLFLRGWKMDYRLRTDTLNAKIKGRLLVGATIKTQMKRGQEQLAVCRFPERTIDHPINRIFRYTLKACRDILREAKFTKDFERVWSGIRYCEEHLAAAQMPRNVTNADFRDASLRGFYRKHGHVLALAKAVVRSEQLKSKNKDAKAKVIPFIVYTPHLFERWIAAHAKPIAAEKGWKMEIEPEKRPHKGLPALKPDMVFTNQDGETRVLDAKYKKCWSDFPKGESSDRRADLHQILAYHAAWTADRSALIFPANADEPKESEVNEPKVSFLSVNSESPMEIIEKFLK